MVCLLSSFMQLQILSLHHPRFSPSGVCPLLSSSSGGLQLLSRFFLPLRTAYIPLSSPPLFSCCSASLIRVINSSAESPFVLTPEMIRLSARSFYPSLLEASSTRTSKLYRLYLGSSYTNWRKAICIRIVHK